MMNAMDILKKLVGEGDVVATHSSEVYITKDFVYKVKKPVYFGFLDYRELKLRRLFSLLEKELNSRYSKGVYLGVLKIVQKADGFDLADAESSLTALEYVLKMRRIPDDKFLSYKVARSLVSRKDMGEIGYRIAERLSRADSSPVEVEDMSSFALISYNAAENFIQLKDMGAIFVDKRFSYIEKATGRFLSEHKELFEDRYAKGFVKDGHGDLRLEHVYVENSELGLIDCIEFNKRFRTNDVVSEAAFLSMELDYSGNTELADSFLSGFFKYYSDPDSIKLLNFYRCYRAVVRAKVAVITALGVVKSSELYVRKIEEFNRMIDMALLYALSMETVRPMVFCGMIAAGKSVNAKQFARRFPVGLINSDAVRKAMAGISPMDSAVTEVEKGIYTAERSARVYSEMGKTVAAACRVGRVVIADATFIKKIYQKAFEDELPVKPVYVTFTAPDNVLRERLKARESKAGVSDGRLIHYEEMKKHEGELPAEYVVDSLNDMCMDTIVNFLITE